MTPARRTWWIANAFIALLLLLSLRIVYWQLVRGSELTRAVLSPVNAAQQSENDLKQQTPAPENIFDYLTQRSEAESLRDLPLPLAQRRIELLNLVTRGSIFDRNGRLLAYDYRDADGTRRRWYTEPSLAPVIGYVSGIRSGVAGLEASYDETLLGQNRPDGQLATSLRQPVTGSDLVLTIDSYVQRVAVQALGDRRGAVVALDGKTGAVLAMVSNPTYDPNRMQDEAYLQSLAADSGAPFLNRATQALYTPGSTFKTVTLLAALDSGQVNKDTVFDFGQPLKRADGRIYYEYRVGGGVVPDPNHTQSKLALPLAYAFSANAAFARIGAEMPPDTFIDYAQRLGFSPTNPARFQVEIDYSPSLLAQNVDELRSNDLLRAVTAIGQGQLFVTPLQMSRVVLPVLNNGRLPQIYMVDSIREPGGIVNKGPLKGDSLGQYVRAASAKAAHDMMVGVVTNNVAKAVVPGAVVGGKTGTAQLGGEANAHAWFIGFAEEGDRSVVVAVIVENGGSGANVAVPVFSPVADAALHNLGTAVEEIAPGPGR